MIKHNLPLVRGGSLWQYRWVPLQLQLLPPHCLPSNVNPRTATVSERRSECKRWCYQQHGVWVSNAGTVIIPMNWWPQKFGVADDVGDTYPCAKFHYDPIRGFCSPPPPCLRALRRVQSNSASFFFFGGGGLLATPFREASCTDFHDLDIKWCRFTQGSAFWGSPEISPFDFISPQNANFWPVIDRTENFALKRP